MGKTATGGAFTTLRDALDYSAEGSGSSSCPLECLRP